MWILIWLEELQCSLIHVSKMLFCLFYIFFSSKGSAISSQTRIATFKNKNHGFLQFLNSVSSLRHLPNSSAVKNGTNVALLLYLKKNFPSFLWSLQCHQVSPVRSSSTRNQYRKTCYISVRTFFQNQPVFIV